MIAARRERASATTAPYVMKTTIRGREVQLCFHDPAFPYSPEARTFKVVAFDEDGRILAVRNRRTINLPGGYVAWDDDTNEDAARREVLEATGITLGTVALATVIIATPAGGNPDEASQTLAFAARAFPRPGPRPTLTKDRHAFIQRGELLERHKAGNAEALRRLIEMAEIALSAPHAHPEQ